MRDKSSSTGNRIALYLHSSLTKANGGKTFLEYQRQVLQGWSRTHNCESPRRYTDHGHSGYRLSRPGLKRLLNDAELRKFDVVLVQSLHRLSRKYDDALFIIAKLHSHNIRVKSLDDGFDSTVVDAEARYQVAVVLGRSPMRQRMST